MRANDIRWGLKWGIGMGAFVAMLPVLAGRDAVLASGFTNIPGLVAAYLLTGLIGGLILGTFRRWTRSPWGAALLGLMIGIPGFFMLWVFQDGWSALTTEWDIMVVGGLMVGPGAGVGTWYYMRSRRRRKRRK